jgi:hypothetical protein
LKLSNWANIGLYIVEHKDHNSKNDAAAEVLYLLIHIPMFVIREEFNFGVTFCSNGFRTQLPRQQQTTNSVEQKIMLNRHRKFSSHIRNRKWAEEVVLLLCLQISQVTNFEDGLTFWSDHWGRGLGLGNGDHCVNCTCALHSDYIYEQKCQA